MYIINPNLYLSKIKKASIIKGKPIFLYLK